MRRFAILLAVVASLLVATTALVLSDTRSTETGGAGQAFVFSSTSAQLRLTGTGNGTDYAAVYTTAKAPAGKLLIDVDMGFRIAAPEGQNGYVQGGAPRLTIPIDMNGDGAWDDFASIDWASCGGTVDGNGVLTASVLVSTTSTSCGVNLNGGGSYANWDSFAGANPTYRIAKGQQAFIIADWGRTAVNLTAIDLN